MTDLDKEFLKTGIVFPSLLLPKSDIDYKKWSIIACDQFTSEGEYWKNVKDYVGKSPSSLSLVLPEHYLKKDNASAINSINTAMNNYIRDGIFENYDSSCVFVKRTLSNGLIRHGLVLAIDLEKYSFNENSFSLIRPTEGTIIERIPPRLMIRKNAVLELSHIVLFVNDDSNELFNLLAKKERDLKKIYSFPLMLNGGNIDGFLINNNNDLDDLKKAFVKLYNDAASDKNANKLFLAVGDGNHSLACAKTHWENVKKTLSDKECVMHPARYCLVEIENIHDNAIQFEPIHRVIFSFSKKDFDNTLMGIAKDVKITKQPTLMTCIDKINKKGSNCSFAVFVNNSFFVYEISAKNELSTSAKIIEQLIDNLPSVSTGASIDYIHGAQNTVDVSLSYKNDIGNIAIIMPDINKDDFFLSILNNGAFPRKTFSIGKNIDKRYYIEAKKIVL